MARKESGVVFTAKLLFIYLMDWVVIIGTIAFAGSTSFWAVPNTRPFYAEDLSISFPFQHKAKIPTWMLVLVSILLPGILIFVLNIFRSGEWKRKLYCLNTSWLGLGLAIATAMIITDGLKNLIGRPRPDLLSRCDVDGARIAEFEVGPGKLVTWGVCKTLNIAKGSVGGALDEGDLRDGFRSFPSGHASMSFAGLTYLSIFLAEFVFALPVPYLHTTNPTSAPLVNSTRSSSPPPPPLPPRPAPPSRHASRHSTRRHGGSGGYNSTATASATSQQQYPQYRTAPPYDPHYYQEPSYSKRSSASRSGLPMPRYPIMAAILLCAVPLLAAAYIASTRFSDFRHHPLDIFFGSAVGIGAGILGWRWYGAWCCVQGGERGVKRRSRGGENGGRLRGGEGCEMTDDEEEGEGVRDLESGLKGGGTFDLRLESRDSAGSEESNAVCGSREGEEAVMMVEMPPTKRRGRGGREKSGTRGRRESRNVERQDQEQAGESR